MVTAAANDNGPASASPPAHAWLPTPIDAEARHMMIAQAAYFRAEKRGFAPGFEQDDWLEAEREIARMLDG